MSTRLDSTHLTSAHLEWTHHDLIIPAIQTRLGIRHTFDSSYPRFNHRSRPRYRTIHGWNRHGHVSRLAKKPGTKQAKRGKPGPTAIGRPLEVITQGELARFPLLDHLTEQPKLKSHYRRPNELKAVQSSAVGNFSLVPCMTWVRINIDRAPFPIWRALFVSGSIGRAYAGDAVSGCAVPYRLVTGLIWTWNSSC